MIGLPEKRLRIEAESPDLIFLVTGRYFIHNFSAVVLSACFSATNPDRVRTVFQNPEWEAQERVGRLGQYISTGRQETSVLGFRAAGRAHAYSWGDGHLVPTRSQPLPRLVDSMFGWAYDFQSNHGVCMECHIASIARKMRDWRHACELLPLKITPVREGTMDIWRETL